MQVTKDLISEQEYTELSSLLIRIENEIKTAELQSLLARQVPTIPSPNEPLIDSLFFKPEHSVESLAVRSHEWQKVILPTSTENVHINLPSAPMTLHLKDWAPQADYLLKDLTHFLQLSHQAAEKGHHQEVYDFFIKILRLLPLPSSDLSTKGGQFWQEVIKSHPNEITGLMNSIVDFSHLFYVSCFKINGSLDSPPAKTHAIIKSLHIQNILKEHSSLNEMGLGKVPGAFKFLECFFRDRNNHYFRELWFRSMDPLITEELYHIYLDLQKMSAQYKDLVFDWYFMKDDQTLFNGYNPPDFNSLKNPELVSIKNLLENSPRFVKKADAFYQELFDKKLLSKIFRKPFLQLERNQKIEFIYTIGANALLPSLFS